MTAFGRNTRWRCFGSWAGGVPGDLVGLPRSQLAVLPGSPVLPGTTHITLVHRVEWLTSMIAEFLDLPMPKDEPVP
jgi:hypothetical protein